MRGMIFTELFLLPDRGRMKDFNRDGARRFYMKHVKMNTEMQCAIFASCIFVIFFTSSVVSVVKAEPVSDESKCVPGYSAGFSNDTTVFGGSPDADEPDRMNEPCDGRPKANLSDDAVCFRVPNADLVGTQSGGKGFQAAP